MVVVRPKLKTDHRLPTLRGVGTFVILPMAECHRSQTDVFGLLIVNNVPRPCVRFQP